MKKKSIALNAFLNGFRSVLNIIFPLITFPYVSRVLSVEGIGKYNFSNSYVSYFVLLAGLGVGTYAVREGAKYRDNKENISKFASEVFTINIVSTFLSYILLFLSLLIFVNLRDYISCILIFSIQIFFTTLGTEWIYSIYEDYSFITLRSVIFQILSIILLFIFVKNSSDYLNYAIITVFSAVGANLINFMFARKKCRIKIITRFNWKRHLIPILIIFASNIAITIYVNSDITILGLLKNNYIVGIYSVSTKIYSMIKTLLSSILMVTIPRLAMLYGKGKIREYKDILSLVINNLIIFVFPAMIGLFMLSANVVEIISSKKYISATSSLRILCIGLIFSVVASFFSGCILIPIKREKDVLKGSIVSALINILLNFILIPVLDENAAALSTVIAELTIMIMNMYFAKEFLKDTVWTKSFKKNILDSLIGSAGIVIVCFLIISSYKSVIVQTLLAVVLSVIIYLAILSILKNNSVKRLFNMFSNK